MGGGGGEDKARESRSGVGMRTAIFRIRSEIEDSVVVEVLWWVIDRNSKVPVSGFDWRWRERRRSHLIIEKPVEVVGSSSRKLFGIAGKMSECVRPGTSVGE